MSIFAAPIGTGGSLNVASRFASGLSMSAKDNRSTKSVGVWVASGTALGAAFGAAFGDVAIGVALGVAIGVGDRRRGEQATQG